MILRMFRTTVWQDFAIYYSASPHVRRERECRAKMVAACKRRADSSFVTWVLPPTAAPKMLRRWLGVS